MKRLFVSSLVFLLISGGILRAAIEEIVAEREENIVRIFVRVTSTTKSSSSLLPIKGSSYT